MYFPALLRIQMSENEKIPKSILFPDLEDTLMS
jgi:hypothetical protein